MLSAAFAAEANKICLANSMETQFRPVSNPRMQLQRNLPQNLINQTEIKLYLQFTDLFGTNRTSVWFQINRKIVRTI